MNGNPVGPLLSVPNLSSGRDYHFVRGVRDAVEGAGAAFHSVSWDTDHNRTVAALSGTRGQLFAVLTALARLAFASIDMTRHEGVHPRIGALDVLPVVPTTPEALPEADELVRDLAEAVAAEGVPVFLYGRSARPGRPADVPAIRRGQFEGWAGKELTGEHEPDFGPARLHPTAGAVVMGVRGPLIAFNVTLREPAPALAREIAAVLRSERDRRPELAGVQAMGVALASRGMSQVSTNITDPDAVTMADVLSFVRAMAGGSAAWAEVIGVIRRTDFVRSSEALRSFPHRLWPEQVLEY